MGGSGVLNEENQDFLQDTVLSQMSVWNILLMDARWIFDVLEQNYIYSQKLFNADN